MSKIKSVLCDFNKYSTIQEYVTHCQIISTSEHKQIVSFEVDMFQTVSYTLEFDLSFPDQIPWILLDGGELIKSNHGHWQISELEPDLMDVEYNMTIDFNSWIPDSMIQTVLDEKVPDMLQTFKVAIEKELNTVSPVRN